MSLERAFKWFTRSRYHVLGYPLSFIFYLILKIKKKIGKSSLDLAPPFVISVGNIDFGGSGKTPILLLLLEYFKNINCAVISRGYKSKLESQGSTLINQLLEIDASIIGDEPMLIHSKFPDISLFVGANKEVSLKGCKDKKLIFLDDGAQSSKIRKDISIILVDPQKPIKPLFPAGYRRDLTDTLKDADFVIIPYCETQDIYNKAKTIVKQYSNAKICGFQAQLIVPEKGKKIGLLTSIAKPERLKSQLLALGYDIVYEKFLDDHQSISADLIENFQKKAFCFQAEMLCVTEKDIVKINNKYKQKFSVIELKLIPVYDIEEWQSLIGKIEKMS